MKWKILLLIALVIGAIGGSWLKNLPGFVIIAYEKTSYEMRLWIAISFILIIFSLIIFMIYLFSTLLSGANKVKNWKGNRYFKKARKQTIKGMLAFIEGHWQESENFMMKASKQSDTQLINYLVAAQAAQQQNAKERRDQYIRLAHESEPNAVVAIGLTQAQLQLDSAQYEQALASLNDLENEKPNHPFVLKLLCITYQKLQDWQAIISLIPKLTKQQVFTKEKLEYFESISVKGILQKESNKNELEALEDAWLKLPSASRKNINNIIFYVKLLIQFSQMDSAEKILKTLFKKNVSAEIISLYGNIKSNDMGKQFNFLENWLTNHPETPDEIYLALGNLAYELGLWGKSRYYLERILRVKPCAQSYYLMAKTLQKLEDEDHAVLCFEQGLEFIIGNKKIKNDLVLSKGTDDLVSAGLLPKFEKL